MTTSFWGDAGGFIQDDDENEDQFSSAASWEVGRDGLIFLIDATESMFVKSEASQESPFETCLKCAKNVLMSKIISSDKDVMSVIFFGTEKHQNSSDFKHIYNLQDLDLPDANRILQIEELSNKAGNFGVDYGHSNDFALSDALWACSNMFASSSFKLAQKRILLFTATDDPHESNRELKKRAVKKAKDLYDLGIEFELMHIKQDNKTFGVDKFYRDIMSDEDYNTLSDPTEKFDELLTRVRMKEHKKRALTRLPFSLSGDISLGVSVYSLNRQTAKGQYVKVDSRTNEEVKCITKYICQDTGQELLPTDIKLYQEFGGAKVTFEKEEVEQMKGLVKPGLHLLGFKPRKFLKDYYHVKPSSFIYPDEGSVTGSNNLFTALLKRCLARDVLPICTFALRASAPPRFVALLAQKEELDENRIQIKPPGFHMLYLPYSDDIRKVKLDSYPKATDEQIDKAKEIVDKLKFTYTNDMFENPSLQKFYRCLEAFALDRDEVEEYKDMTLPKTEAIGKKAGNEIKEFKDLVFPENYDSTSTGTKRKATPAGGAGGAKKAKVELADVDIQEAATKGNLNKLTVAILKTFCQANKLKSSSQKKADLIAAINNHFGV